MLGCMPKRRELMILNYHRIGNAVEPPYDSGTFSATSDEFESHIASGRMQLIATIEDPAVIQGILAHLGLLGTQDGPPPPLSNMVHGWPPLSAA
jgi:hypothetical protein